MSRAAAKLINGKPAISERLFQEQVRKAAIITGWLFFHPFYSMRSADGWPDCVLVHPQKRRLIVAELKTDTGKVTEKQQVWLEAWRQIPCAEVYLLRPGDFDSFFEELKR